MGCQRLEDCLMLWKDTLLGDVGSDVARIVRLRKE